MEQASPARVRGSVRHPLFLTLQSREEGEKSSNTVTEGSMEARVEHSEME